VGVEKEVAAIKKMAKYYREESNPKGLIGYVCCIRYNMDRKTWEVNRSCSYMSYFISPMTGHGCSVGAVYAEDNDPMVAKKFAKNDSEEKIDIDLSIRLESAIKVRPLYDEEGMLYNKNEV